MVIVAFAVPHEGHDIRRALNHAARFDVGGPLHDKVHMREILIAQTGIGTAAAEKTMRGLIPERRPRWVLSTGYAGALDPMIEHGELFIATNFTTSEISVRRPAHRGILTTQNALAETAQEKAALARSTGAQAVDMETAPIARVCMEHSIPLLSLRVISDTASTRIPVPLAVSYDLARQRPRPAALLKFLAQHPRRILPFIRFVRGLATARAAVTSAIVEILEREPLD